MRNLVAPNPAAAMCVPRAMDTRLRKPLVIASVAFAIGAPALQALAGLGLSASEFASQGDSTLRAAGYAFSIWTLIYAGLIAYAVWQALPRNNDDPLLRRLAAPSIVAIAGCGLWICASALNWRWASVAIIVASATTLSLGLIRAAASGPAARWSDRLFVWWPLGLLAGWLTVASAINIVTVLTAEGLITDLPRTAAFVGIVAVLAAALLVLRTSHLGVYGIPVGWGLVAVWMAENGSKNDVAALALGSAVLVGAYAVWQARPSAARR